MMQMHRKRMFSVLNFLLFNKFTCVQLNCKHAFPHNLIIEQTISVNYSQYCCNRENGRNFPISSSTPPNAQIFSFLPLLYLHLSALPYLKFQLNAVATALNMENSCHQPCLLISNIENAKISTMQNYGAINIIFSSRRMVALRAGDGQMDFLHKLPQILCVTFL